MTIAHVTIVYAACVISNTIRVDLIPLGVSFNGYMKVLRVPITIPIFSWQADTIYGKYKIFRLCPGYLDVLYM